MKPIRRRLAVGWPRSRSVAKRERAAEFAARRRHSAARRALHAGCRAHSGLRATQCLLRGDAMFRNFKPSEHIKSQTKVKSSEQRNVRTNVLEQFPSLEPHIEDLLPKKKDLIICKCQDHITLVLDPAGEPIFFHSTAEILADSSANSSGLL